MWSVNCTAHLTQCSCETGKELMGILFGFLSNSTVSEKGKWGLFYFLRYSGGLEIDIHS